LRIARLALVDELADGEMYLADGGYCDKKTYGETPSGLKHQDLKMKAVARARHETINRLVKYRSAAGGRFRHPLEKHRPCVGAIVNIVQLSIQRHGGKVFAIDYDDHGV